MSKIHNILKLSSSNKQKIAEYKAFNIKGMTVVAGEDHKEVKADADTVALYKAMSAGENIIVDDTILVVNDEEVVDIRWKLDEVAKMDSPKIQWIVTLSVQDGDFIYIYKGVVDCDTRESDMDPFGYHAFDPFLSPKGVEESFYQLDLKGEKAKYSPRTKAIEKLMIGDFYKKVSISEIKPWTGEYQ